MTNEYDETINATIDKLEASGDLPDAPDIIIADDDEPEYWRDIAAYACRNDKVEERKYIADITDTMTSPEVGPQLGGECTVFSDPMQWDVSEFRVSCTLDRAYKTDTGRWLAVYFVEAV